MDTFLFTKYFDSPKSTSINIKTDISNIIILDSEGTTDEVTLLNNIFKAINVDIANECFILDITKVEKFRLSQLNQLSNIENVFFFGLDANDLGLHINMIPYNFTVHQNRNYLHSDSLQLINTKKELKMKLWMALKNKFTN